MEDHIVFYEEDAVLDLLDQRFLPTKETRYQCHCTDEVIYAIQTLVVRGAAASGIATAYGCAIALREASASTGNWKPLFADFLTRLRGTRPTTVTVAMAVDRISALAAGMPAASAEALYKEIVQTTRILQAGDTAACHAIGQAGLSCIPQGATIMTHGYAGSLATAGYGTALGVIRAAWNEGYDIKVVANETRPSLQGARLTAWELRKEGIPVTLACDNACSFLMAHEMVDRVVVSADRIAANGDIAYTIGTSGIAILAHHYGIPFYVAAPTSLIDPDTPDGGHILIEQRPDEEITSVDGIDVTLEDIPVYNFAFDVTPAELISGIITEKGLLTAPYTKALANVLA